MAKSKSKTFPKGTDWIEIINWLSNQMWFTGKPEGSASKYLITITKLPEKGR